MPINRFMSYVNKTETCWNWTGGTTHFSHGKFWLNNRTIIAHRFSYEIHIGPIPKGLCVLHKCDNPRCVNPDHLFIGTKMDNTTDMYAKGRNNNLKGSANGSSKLTEDQIDEIKRLYRTKKFSQQALADKFNVCQANICNILNGKIWKHKHRKPKIPVIEPK